VAYSKGNLRKGRQSEESTADTSIKREKKRSAGFEERGPENTTSYSLTELFRCTTHESQAADN